jgi:hypothetical protein
VIAILNNGTDSVRLGKGNELHPETIYSRWTGKKSEGSAG